MSTPTLERLSAQFTELIGPVAFAKAAAAAEAARIAAEAAKAAAAAVAAAKPAVAATAAASKPVSAAPAANTTSPTAAGPAVAKPASPAAAVGSVAPKPAPASPAVAPAAPRPVTPPAPPAPPASPLQATAHNAKGYDLDATVAPQQVVAAARLLDAAGFALDAVTGVDWIAQNEMEVVYDFFHPTQLSGRVVVRTRVPRATPEVPTIIEVFPGANWHERETHDFFGITFTGHPNMKPFLLPEDANFHPLRKDYAP